MRHDGLHGTGASRAPTCKVVLMPAGAEERRQGTSI